MLDKISILHAPILEKIHQQCFEKSWDKKSFEALLRLPHIQGVISENGFILATFVAGVLEIITFCVLPHYRRQGEGQRLFNQLIRQVSADEIFLEVNCQNKDAIEFYKKNLFQEIGRRKGYYDGIDALVLKRILK